MKSKRGDNKLRRRGRRERLGRRSGYINDREKEQDRERDRGEKDKREKDSHRESDEDEPDRVEIGDDDEYFGPEDDGGGAVDPDMEEWLRRSLT